MSTKYSVSRRSRWSINGNPTMTDHAAFERWDERTPPDSVAPETAYERAVDVSEIAHLIRDASGQTPDRLRYFYEKTAADSYGALFLVKHGVIKTVYRVDSLDDGPTRAYLAAHNHLFTDADEYGENENGGAQA